MLYVGTVENRKDPMMLGRCQVRIVGLHTHDKTKLPTDDLPWAYPMQSINSAAISGIGSTPLGPVEGTWVIIMFNDAADQMPIMLGSIGGIPQKDTNIFDSTDEITIKSDNAQTTTNGNQSETSAAEQTPVETTTAQSSVKPPNAKAKAGIAALEKAMDAAGINGKYGRAAILGICGGESAWIPQREGYSYSVEGLIATFPKTFKNRQQLAEKYARWKGSREDFFDFVYAPENNGSQLGNTQPGDGGKYYGRGFVQLTGRSNYNRYGRLANIDLINNPDVLANDYDVSAQVTVAYFSDRVGVNSNDPSYFQKALTAVGGARSGWPKKEAYYKYFLGEGAPEDQTDKTTKPGAEAQGVPTTDNGLPEDRQQNVVMGFTDPNMKYPLRQYIGEPDTNRLARGNIKGTVVEFKDGRRLDGVITAGGVSWNQPDIPYNAKYPFNHVTETESGHIMEFDDTPDNERIHLYHRKGTYTEIDANGTQVNRIVGDGYIIMERNGYVLINGECNVTIAGKTRILCKDDARIDVGANAYINTAENLEINAGGELRIKAVGIKMESTANFDLKVVGTNHQTSGSSFEVNAGAQARIEAPTVHMADGAATATGSGLGGSIEKTEKAVVKEQLKPPPRNLETEMEYETEEENQTEEAQAYHTERKKDEEAAPVEPQEEVKEDELPENKAKPIKANCAVIYELQSIPDSYVLHTDGTGFKWTLGMLTKGRSITPGVFKLNRADVTGRDMSKAEIICNLKNLAENILGPINENIGRHGTVWTITSCYRNNIPLGGSATSQHLYGSAVDFVIGGNNFAYKQNYDVAVKLTGLVPFDQLLLEYRDPGVNGNQNSQKLNWVHVSYNNYGGGRKEVSTFLNDKTYAKGLTRLA